MTAGAGILHIETPPESLVMSGGLFHGIQLWVNLPAKDKFTPPAYQNLDGQMSTLLASGDGGALVRLIAGSIGEHRGPGSTHTPITLAHATIAPGARMSIPWPADYNALVYVLSGAATIGADNRPIHQGQLAVLGAGDRVGMTAASRQDSNRAALEVLLLGGRPIGEAVVQYGPFVMSTVEELQQAMDDYRAGKLGVIPANAIMPHTN
jgi:hypothetical protein